MTFAWLLPWPLQWFSHVGHAILAYVSTASYRPIECHFGFFCRSHSVSKVSWCNLTVHHKHRSEACRDQCCALVVAFDRLISSSSVCKMQLVFGGNTQKQASLPFSLPSQWLFSLPSRDRCSFSWWALWVLWILRVLAKTPATSRELEGPITLPQPPTESRAAN